MTIIIREMVISDYPQVNELWKQTENIGISSADSQANLSIFLQRNPGLNFVSVDQQLIVGAVLGGNDGRRGAIYHLAVQKEYRGNGIGKFLLEHCLQGFKLAGIERCHIHVYADNHQGLKFWQKNGWFLRPELVLLSKDQTINNN
jgi:ribosomal protein S18 acetylase RimI-like enzyme